jgi:hypothetical protein
MRYRYAFFLLFAAMYIRGLLITPLQAVPGRGIRRFSPPARLEPKVRADPGPPPHPRYPEKWTSLSYRIAVNYFVCDLTH